MHTFERQRMRYLRIPSTQHLPRVMPMWPSPDSLKQAAWSTHVAGYMLFSGQRYTRAGHPRLLPSWQPVQWLMLTGDVCVQVRMASLQLALASLLLACAPAAQANTVAVGPAAAPVAAPVPAAIVAPMEAPVADTFVAPLEVAAASPVAAPAAAPVAPVSAVPAPPIRSGGSPEVRPNLSSPLCTRAPTWRTASMSHCRLRRVAGSRVHNLCLNSQLWLHKGGVCFSSALVAAPEADAASLIDSVSDLRHGSCIRIL